MEKNSFPLGLLIGALTPIIGYYLVSGIFDLLVSADIMGAAPMGLHSQRMRTILLLSLCTSLIPFNLLKNYKLDRTMQGMIFPTLIYAGVWLYYYGRTLF